MSQADLLVSIKQRLRFARDVFDVIRSSLFDAAWYERTYSVAAATGIEPSIHFLTEGWRLGFDPGPEVSSNWYLEQNPNVWASGINPLLHYLRGGAAEGRLPHPEWTNAVVPGGSERAITLNELIRDGSLIISSFFTTNLSYRLASQKTVMVTPRYVRGRVKNRPEAKSVLVCAHASGRQLFGAERSLLDVLEAMNNLGLNVITTLPTSNPDYEISIARLCQGVYVFPYPQWSKEFSEIEDVIETFENIIEECEVDVVHVNTIMIREALTAARRLDRATVVHARELIDADSTLAAAIAQRPADIVSMVLEKADFIIANSAVTAKCYRNSERVFVVSNCVDVTELDISNDVDPASITIALVGSNTRKKGIDDFSMLAKFCIDKIPNAKFLAIGSGPVEGLGKCRNVCPENLTFPGYVNQTVAAIQQANIIVNLSSVPESFGRTVAEAMAARRPVIAYDHGAVSDMIENGGTGFLVPVGDIHAVLARIEQLCTQPELIDALGERGRQVAVVSYSAQVAHQQLSAAYRTILQTAGEAVV